MAWPFLLPSSENWRFEPTQLRTKGSKQSCKKETQNKNRGNKTRKHHALHFQFPTNINQLPCAVSPLHEPLVLLLPHSTAPAQPARPDDVVQSPATKGLILTHIASNYSLSSNQNEVWGPERPFSECFDDPVMDEPLSSQVRVQQPSPQRASPRSSPPWEPR